MDAGIVSYGAYVPRYRITPEEIGKVWGTDGVAMGAGLGVHRKSVPAPDEDTITISTEALRSGPGPRRASTPRRSARSTSGASPIRTPSSPPRPSSPRPSGATPNLTAADFEFACKAGTAAIQTCLGLVGAGMIRYGVAIGSDTSQGAPGDALEYSASAGGAAFVIGRERVIAQIQHTLSYTTDTPDFWRREGQRYPSHGGRFTGEPAYFRHVGECAQPYLRAGRDHAEGLQLRGVPPAQRQVPAADRRAARVHRRPDALRASSPRTSATPTPGRPSSGSPTCSTTRSPTSGSCGRLRERCRFRRVRPR